ncbi:MAG: MFS transporter [Clostridia bacterium]|nr:MFS transporter [Clostridia bacterium]
MSETTVSSVHEHSAQENEEILKQLEQQHKNYLSPRDYVAYILSGAGDKNWETFNSQQSDFFYRTFLNAKPNSLSVASVVSLIVDTFDNAISGPIIDRTRTRWGRVRPYLLFTLPLWVAGSLAPWLLPGHLSQLALIIIFTIDYYLTSIANSFYQPSYQALLFNLTPNVEERNRLIATDTYIDLLGVWLPSLFPFFVDFLKVDTRLIYSGGAILFIAMVIVFRTFGFFALRERVPLATKEDMQQVSIWKSVKQVMTCQPMWILLLKNFFAVGKAVGARVQNDFWLNCFGKISYGTIAGLVTGLPSYFVLPFAPKMTRKMGLKNLASFSYGFCGVAYFIMYLVGYNPTKNTIVNFVWVTLALTACGAFNSVQRYCSTALTGDLYDYIEWKTGIRSEGTVSAAMNYVNLLINPASTFISSGIIEAAHIKSVYRNGRLVRQTNPQMLKSLWAVFALAPAVGRTAKAVTLWFFKVHGKTREQMMRELAEIRASKVLDTGAAAGETESIEE